ncbi:putative lipid II flippase FtsW [Cellulomonas algicola]|uniref:Probable peptidoglycan glycosyltransferase FtsW n=1 Tax=Cellulomonas algicola TaxID=2071633 RepID=A0A401V3D7_9CELL|nr:putative lipid II flippase FtsW [Cellulomonas algicola]GCD21423.1 cell division protein FtsW [Cellulomonas algicola]
MADTATATAEPRGSALGQWNSAVTSYYVLLGATTLLLVIGLVMVLSSSSVESLDEGNSPYAVFADQAKFALIGLPLLVILSRVPVRVMQAFAWPVLGAAIVFQLLVFVPGLGCGEGGNRNWVCVGGMSAQPSEAIKLALAVWLGAVLARKLPLLHEWKHALIPVVPIAGLAVLVVLAGHDLGTALVLLMLVAGALFVAGVPLRMFGLAAVAGAAVAFVLTVTSDNRTDRITSWLSTEGCDTSSACYQTLHGGWGLASGGWGGLGLGESREKWSYLPAAHNDFIFAIIGEELGLIGTLLVLGLFGLMALAMVRVIRRHPDPFVQITTGAVLCWIIGQAFVNVAVVIGLAPVIGLPLPLVSAGGSALIMTMAALGVVISFARSEPGAAEALAARPSVVRRSLAVIGRSRG